MVTIRLRSMVWFVTGAMLATAVTLMFVNAWRVDAAPGDSDSTFVPITACRLMDTRPAPDRVGPHAAWGVTETKTVQATGANGKCTIPSEAVGLSMNVTALNATAAVGSFLTFWPDGALPLAASLNPSPGQPPVPNAVTVRLSGTGAFNLYNETGSVDIIIDVNGYYTKSSLIELHTRLAAAEAKIGALKTAQPFSVTAEDPGVDALTITPTAYVSVSVTAPVAGHVTLNSTAGVFHPVDDGDVFCAIFETGSIPPTSIGSGTPSYQQFEGFDLSDNASLSGTRRFGIDAGATVSYSLACQESGGDGGFIDARNVTAIFTPAP